MKKKILKSVLKKREKRRLKREEKLKWKNLQKELLKRDNYRCVFCNKKINLKHYQSCHIIPEEFKETKYDINNLLLACFYHHKVGKFSIHNHPLWFVEWLKTNRLEQYQYLLNFLK